MHRDTKWGLGIVIVSIIFLLYFYSKLEDHSEEPGTGVSFQEWFDYKAAVVAAVGIIGGVYLMARKKTSSIVVNEDLNNP